MIFYTVVVLGVVIGGMRLVSGSTRFTAWFVVLCCLGLTWFIHSDQGCDGRPDELACLDRQESEFARFIAKEKAREEATRYAPCKRCF
jgi:uncharacterized membrane protein YphA (DoxX/SURF4 family)